MDVSVLCLSPAFDATVRTDAPGAVPPAEVDARDAAWFPGGKGLNVARHLALRGASVRLCGLLGEADAGAFSAELARYGIADAMRRIPGRVRRNTCAVFPGGTDKRNEPAFPDFQPPPDFEDALFADLRGPADRPPPDWAVLTGSLPPRVPAGLYGALARRLRAAGCRVAADAAGEPLRLALDAGVDLAKPNRDECEGWLGRPVRTPDGFRRALEALGRHAAFAIVSDGARGAWFGWTEPGRGFRAVSVPAPAVDAVDPTGAGDALLAEACLRLPRGAAPSPADLAAIVAAGSAATATQGALPGALPLPRR